MKTLFQTQLLFLSALAEPLTGEDRQTAGLPDRGSTLSASFRTTAESLLKSSEQVHASERLGLYQRQYWYRLFDSLREDFPHVERLLGRPRLLTSFESFLTASPPDHWSLRRLGKSYAAHLRTDATLTAREKLWASSLADYDFAHMEVFDTAVSREPADSELRTEALVLSPSVRWVTVGCALSAWLALEGSQIPEAGEARELHLVWRDKTQRLRARQESIELLPLLQSLARGGTLEEVLEHADPLPPPELLHDAFQRWRASGWIVLSPAPAPFAQA